MHQSNDRQYHADQQDEEDSCDVLGLLILLVYTSHLVPENEAKGQHGKWERADETANLVQTVLVSLPDTLVQNKPY